MKENKFAELTSEQVKEVHQLEEKLHVILLAYDHFQNEGNIPQENIPTINPS